MIVSALRQAGASVETMHMVGHGFPDLAAGYHGDNYFIEVKNPRKPKADQQLTADQQAWHDQWRGRVAIAYTIEDALRIVGAI